MQWILESHPGLFHEAYHRVNSEFRSKRQFSEILEPNLIDYFLTLIVTIDFTNQRCHSAVYEFFYVDWFFPFLCC